MSNTTTPEYSTHPAVFTERASNFAGIEDYKDVFDQYKVHRVSMVWRYLGMGFIEYESVSGIEVRRSLFDSDLQPPVEVWFRNDSDDIAPRTTLQMLETRFQSKIMRPGATFSRTLPMYVQSTLQSVGTTPVGAPIATTARKMPWIDFRDGEDDLTFGVLKIQTNVPRDTWPAFPEPIVPTNDFRVYLLFTVMERADIRLRGQR